MRHLLTVALAFMLAVTLNSEAFAKDKKVSKKKAKGHCEKVVGGKHKDLPKIKSRKACKKAGGKWTRKSHKKDNKHEDHDNHNHEDEHDHSD